MDKLPPAHRIRYAYLGRIYALSYHVRRRTVLGIKLSTLLIWAPLLVLLVGRLQRWPWPALLFLFLIWLWLLFSLWQSRRVNYNRFVPGETLIENAADLRPLPPNQKVPTWVTGLFSVSGRENTLLLRPASYWRVPLGEHVIMAEEQPGKYLYQFFNAESLQEIRRGWLVFGSKPRETLAVTFLSAWGPEYTQFGPQYDSDNKNGPPPRRVTVYMSFEDEEAERAVRQTIIDDARRARGG